MNIYFFLYKHIKIESFRSRLIALVLKMEKGQPYSSTIRKIYRTFYHIEIGYGTYGGCFVLSNMRPNIKIGNYCSIASGVKIFRANHPITSFTTHPITYEPLVGGVKKALTYKKLEIGHDVWIGSDVIILPSVDVIGDGAIIGAGSVVTKSIPPYMIAVGNPAKVIRRRFNDNIINKLEDTKWWNLLKDDLVKQIPQLNKIAKGEV